MRLRAAVAVVVAFSLLGSAAGAVLGWASGPVHPDVERAWWFSRDGQVARRMADNYMGVLERYVAAGMLIGGFVGGMAGVAGVLLVVARNPPTPANRERRAQAPDYQERALADAARQAASDSDPAKSADRSAGGAKRPWKGWE